MKVAGSVEYDYLEIKSYDVRVQEDEGEKLYILSFSDKHHVKVSEIAKIIIDLFNGKHTLKEIKNCLHEKEIKITEEDLKKFVKEILVDKAMLVGTEFKNKKVNTMLWAKIPLIDSCKLGRLFSVLRYAFGRNAILIGILCILICLVMSLYIVLNMKEEYSPNSILILIIGYTSLIIHEFGHASAAYKYRINVGKIGIGMYFFYPVMYIDMTNAWRLESKQRVLVDFGGMYFQALTIIPLTIAGLLSNNYLYYICSIYVFSMSVYNLLPFLKLDGYWLFCDYFELNNLSHNAFGVVRKQMLEKDNKLNKKKKVYFVFSLIYSLSIIFMFCIGIIYSFITITNWKDVVEAGNKIVLAFQSSDFKDMFEAINSVFVYVLPVIVMGVMLIKGVLKCFIRKENKK